MIHRPLPALALLLLFGLSLSNCKLNNKPTGQGDTKTLDNLAAGKTIRENSCKGTASIVIPRDRIVFDGAQFAGSTGDAAKDEYRGYVHEYLSALPADVQQAFLNFGGSILVSEKAGDLCAASFSDANSPQYLPAGRQELESCFIYTRGQPGTPNQDKAIFTVVHKPNAKAIRHGGLRVFGFMFAQFFPRLAKNTDPNSPAPYVFNSSAFRDETGIQGYKRKLAHAFLTDVVDKGLYDLGSLAPLLGQSAKATIIANVVNGSGDPLRGVTYLQTGETQLSTDMQNIRRDRLFDYVFAEAFDSMRCSTATLAAMKTEFPKTHREFLGVDAAILTLSAQLAQSTTALLTGDQGVAGGAALTADAGDFLRALLYPAAGGLRADPALQTQTAPVPAAQIVPNNAQQTDLNNLMAVLQGLFSQMQNSGCPSGTCQCSGGGCCGGGCAGGGCASCSGCSTCSA